MTITATANPVATPPSVTVALSVTSGHVMSALSVWRNDHNGRTLLRTQPTAGFDSRTVTDNECPYEENVTYDWTATSSDPASAVTLFSESWPSTASWTVTGVASVSGGRVRNTSSSLILSRYFLDAKYRVSFGYWAQAGSVTGYIRLGGSTGTLQLSLTSGVLSVGVIFGSSVTTTIDANQPFTIDYNATSVTISGTGGSATVSGNYSAGLIQMQTSGSTANQFQVGAVMVKSYAPSTNTAQTSSPVSLSPADAWLIHPGSVALSVPLAETNATAAGIVDIAPIENTSHATVHKILGSSTPIPTTTGPRGDDSTTLTLATVTSAESLSLIRLLASDVPLLIQIPPSWDLDFNCGFYRVGDSADSRTSEPGSPRRQFTLPVQKVQSPHVEVVNSGWSYARLAGELESYLAVPATFATYADLAANTRL